MRKLLILLCLITIAAAVILLCTGAAVEPPVRNILFVHVPASICALLCFTVVFICSIGYLRTRKPRCDDIAAGAGEAGLVFATVMNLTGMLFARAEWGIYWTPSMRLVTAAVLWFLYVAYVLLRISIEKDAIRAKIAAIFGIIAFIDVPLVYASARLVRDIHRPSFTFETNAQRLAFILAMLAALALAAIYIWTRAEIAALNQKIIERNRRE